MPLHRDVGPDGAEGSPEGTLTVTLAQTGADVSQSPLAVTQTWAVPLKEGSQFTVPVDPVPETELPVPLTVHVKLIAPGAAVV